MQVIIRVPSDVTVKSGKNDGAMEPEDGPRTIRPLMTERM